MSGKSYTITKDMNSVESGTVRKLPMKKESDNSIKRIVYGIFIFTMCIDIPVMIVFLVIGTINRATCEVIAPLFLMLGGGFAIIVYLLLLCTIFWRRKHDTSGAYGQIFANLFEILKFGCYMGAAFTMWIFWSSKCSRAVYYLSAVVAPICGLLSIVQLFIIAKV